MELHSKILITGATGMVGSALARNLLLQGYTQLFGTCYSSHASLADKALKGVRYIQTDLTDQRATANLFDEVKPDYVFLASAKVGGIMANNTYRGQFIYENLQMQNNIIHQSYLHGVKKLLFLGSSCIYPKNAPQPLREEYLLQNELEYTNEPYAIAKIAGIKMCESYNLQYGTNYVAVMPTNLYGPNDNYDLEKSHVLPALIRKAHLAKLLKCNDIQAIKTNLLLPDVTDNELITRLKKYGIASENGQVTLRLWGSGTPMREFLHVNDMAEACVYVMNHIDFAALAAGTNEVRNTHINIGTGEDLSIAQLAQLVANTVGYDGQIQWDSTKPDGTLRKLLDVSKIKGLGWNANISLPQGIAAVYADYVRNN